MALMGNAGIVMADKDRMVRRVGTWRGAADKAWLGDVERGSRGLAR
jgi:hypothetical protein